MSMSQYATYADWMASVNPAAPKANAAEPAPSETDINSAIWHLRGTQADFDLAHRLLRRVFSASTPSDESANARLIAAAPDLLEALKQVSAVLDAFGNLSDGRMCPAAWRNHKAEEKIAAAFAAIAKATGQ